MVVTYKNLTKTGIIMSETKLEPHPAVAYGNSIDDPSVTVINVTEGDFEGTIFSYNEVKEDATGQLVFSTDFHIFKHKGKFYEKSPAAKILREFHDTVSVPVMHNIIVLVAEESEQEKKLDTNKAD
jgi:hypothetical protein